jgi:hypothetical protein
MNSQEFSTDAQSSNAIVRPARPDDADEIARIYIESAEHHANLDPARYAVPSVAEIAARYRDGRQIHVDAVAITLIAERDGDAQESTLLRDRRDRREPPASEPGHWRAPVARSGSVGP